MKETENLTSMPFVKYGSFFGAESLLAKIVLDKYKRTSSAFI